MTQQADAQCTVRAAEAVGAPLSELSRLLMRHEPAMDVTVPVCVADGVVCAARGWGVAEPVAGAWLLADGLSRLVQAADAGLLDRLTEQVPGLDITSFDNDNDNGDDLPRLRVQIPGPELCVALDRIARLAHAQKQDVAAVAVAWGLARLHDTEDGHDCNGSHGVDASAGAEQLVAAAGAVDAHEAAVLSEVPLEPLALALLAPKQVLAVSLPGFVDDWVVCIARRWQAAEPVIATWLLVEGAGYLYAREAQRDTSWRTGPQRWVLPTAGPTGPQRLVELPGEGLQTVLGLLMSLTGDDQAGIVALAVAVGARMWLDDHGCACGPRHSPGTDT